MKKIIFALAICFLQFTTFSQSKNDQLFKAIQLNETEKVKLLLNAGCDPNYFIVGNPYIEVSCLIAAVNHNNIDMVKLLIENKADVNWKDNLKNSAVVYAVKNGNLDMVKLLIDKGAAKNEIDSQGKTILFIANEYKHTELANYLEQKVK